MFVEKVIPKEPDIGFDGFGHLPRAAECQPLAFGVDKYQFQIVNEYRRKRRIHLLCEAVETSVFRKEIGIEAWRGVFIFLRPCTRAYMAVITYGGIVVPILQDFNPNDVHHIVNHSESVFLFTSDAIWEHLEEERLTGLRGVFSLNDFRCLYQRDGETIQRFLKHLGDKMEETYPNGFTREDVTYTDLSNDKIMLLNYTSGTTGFSKGVMLTGNNLAGNVTFGIRTELLKKGDKVLSFLPLAHAYGCAFDFLTATAVGTHVTLLGKVPSPKILMKAFEEVKPNLIITVPLVIEKIYKNVIQPIINKKSMKWALSIPLLDGQIYGQIRKKLVDALGGRFKEVIIGGAAMNPEVEEFFHVPAWRSGRARRTFRHTGPH